MKRGDIIRYLVLRTLGNFLVLFTVFGFIATFGPSAYYEVAYRIGNIAGVSYSLEVPAATTSELGEILARHAQDSVVTDNGGGQSLLGAVLTGEKEQILVPKSSEFSVVIPKIGANEKVASNVDPSNKEEYLRVLQSAVAHAKGSAFPGLNGTTYLFAHSADNFWNVGRYNAVFYLLKELENNDEVIVFYDGVRYNYQVFDKKIVDPDEVDYISANLGQGEQLILQTCWPPGTPWKRMLVFAKPVNATALE